MTRHAETRLLDRALLTRAAADSFRKLHPRRMAKNPVMFVVEIGAVLATLALASPARWIAESVPVEEVRELTDGAFEIDLVVRDTGWFVRLVLEEAENVLAIAPAELHAAVTGAATAALEAYDG